MFGQDGAKSKGWWCSFVCNMLSSFDSETYQRRYRRDSAVQAASIVVCVSDFSHAMLQLPASFTFGIKNVCALFGRREVRWW